MLRRQLTLEDTPNDLQRGDLLLFPGYKGNGVFFAIYCGHSVTRKTMNLLNLSLRYELPHFVEQIQKKGVESFAWKQAGMLALNNKPFSRIETPDSMYWSVLHSYIPYSPDLLPPFLRKRYNDICQLLGV